MLVRCGLFLINAGWLFPVPTTSLKWPEMFPKDLLRSLLRDQSENDRAVVLWIVLFNVFEDGYNVCLSPIVRDLTPPLYPCSHTLRTLSDTYLLQWTWAVSVLTISP